MSQTHQLSQPVGGAAQPGMSQDVTRPGQHVQQKRAMDIAAIESLTSIFSKSVPRTLQGSKAWPAYSAEVCHTHSRNRRPGQHIQQKCATETAGIASLAIIFSRSVPRTLQESKAWPAHSAEVCHRHSRNRRPGQHIQQKCATDIAEIEGLANIFSGSVPQTS